MDSQGIPNYNFVKAEKKITSPELLNKFLKSQTYIMIVEFIKVLQESCKGKKRSDVPPAKSPCLLAFSDLFKALHTIIDNTPPYKESQRFGNKAFKEVYEKFEKDYDNLILTTILKEKPNDKLAMELKSYFMDCLGSGMRIDYGTGHELNFLCILLILCQTGYYKNDEFSYATLVVFFDYILLVRRIQVTYKLEPAGVTFIIYIVKY